LPRAGQAEALPRAARAYPYTTFKDVTASDRAGTPSRDNTAAFKHRWPACSRVALDQASPVHARVASSLQRRSNVVSATEDRGTFSPPDSFSTESASLRPGGRASNSFRLQGERFGQQYRLFSIGIRSGCGQDARAFLEQLEWERETQYVASEQPLGITRDLWVIQDTPSGLQFVV
jgi:hypothetical protein